MPRPSRIKEKRAQLLPIVAQAFAELGYRRATTAELALRCEVKENVLYRLWPDKKSMFIATLEYIYDLSEQRWQTLLMSADETQTTAQRILSFDAHHRGDLGLYHIVFAGLSELDDPDILLAMTNMYQRFHKYILQQMQDHRGNGRSDLPDANLSAWAMIGLGTIANIAEELSLLSRQKRRQLIEHIGLFLLDGQTVG